MEGPINTVGAIVLTTHERSGYFTSVLGYDVDMRFDPRQEPQLEDMLHNVIVAGGRLAIIDEMFFKSPDDMACGLERFLREEQNPERLKLIIVCNYREPGDRLLAFLVMYCGIYNIVFGTRGVGVSMELTRLLQKGNSRSDVLCLCEQGRWTCLKSAERALPAGGGTQRNAAPTQYHRDLIISADNPGLFRVSIQVDML